MMAALQTPRMRWAIVLLAVLALARFGLVPAWVWRESMLETIANQQKMLARLEAKAQQPDNAALLVSLTTLVDSVRRNYVSATDLQDLQLGVQPQLERIFAHQNMTVDSINFTQAHAESEFLQVLATVTGTVAVDKFLELSTEMERQAFWLELTEMSAQRINDNELRVRISVLVRALKTEAPIVSDQAQTVEPATSGNAAESSVEITTTSNLPDTATLPAHTPVPEKTALPKTQSAPETPALNADSGVVFEPFTPEEIKGKKQ